MREYDPNKLKEGEKQLENFFSNPPEPKHPFRDYIGHLCSSPIKYIGPFSLEKATELSALIPLFNLI